MGIKIKKDTKTQLQNLPRLHIKYNLVVPIMGIVDILTMGSFYMNPATDGRTGLKLFFVLCALIGAGFTIWGLLWRTTVDGKKIRVNSVFGAPREVPFSDLKLVEVHKKPRTGSLVYYELIDVRGKGIVKIYPLMKDSSVLLERLKRLGIKIEEK